MVQKPEKETTATTTAKNTAATESDYEKIVLEGKTYYKKDNKYFKATVDGNGEITYTEIGETGK